MFLALKVGKVVKYVKSRKTHNEITYLLLSYYICYEMKTIIGIIYIGRYYNIELLFFRYLACEYLPLLMSQKESY